MTVTIEENTGVVETDLVNDIDLEGSVKSLTLSDLIRAGSKDTKQAFGSWGVNGEACALHAAALELKRLESIGEL